MLVAGCVLKETPEFQGRSSILTLLIIRGYGEKHPNCSAGFRKRLRLRTCMLQLCDATSVSLHDHPLRETAFELKTRKCIGA